MKRAIVATLVLALVALAAVILVTYIAEGLVGGPILPDILVLVPVPKTYAAGVVRRLITYTLLIVIGFIVWKLISRRRQDR